MKPLRLFSDFALGVLLIGGAPVCALVISVMIGNGIRKFSGPDHSDGSDPITFFFALLLALAAFTIAVRYRFERRLLPRGVIALEIGLGIVGAFFAVIWYAIMAHFIID